MKPQTIISKKRDGATLTSDEIAAFIAGVIDESWADYQIAAVLMACYLRGLNQNETRALTDAMLHSGEILDFGDLGKPIADKHSTGGVGDKTSLIIAPLAAACGLIVPMISGRGLGHTGGTLDKLESIAGYNVNLSLHDFKKVVQKCGFAMIGQTPEIAPADKKLYALRDATATVDSIGLIVASIMSKKLAEGLDALVLDVKTGNGAFMQSFADAENLAQAMCAVGAKFGVTTTAVISDMNQPLGQFVGHALEVYESIKILRGETQPNFRDTLELSIELTARMLVASKICESLPIAENLCHTKLQSGAALEKFAENIQLQNGDANVCDNPEKLLDQNLHKVEVKAARSGFVQQIDAKIIGQTISNLGGGRAKIDDRIDFQIGFSCEKKIGDAAQNNESLGVLICRSEAQADSVIAHLQTAFQIEDEPPQRLELIKRS